MSAKLLPASGSVQPDEVLVVVPALNEAEHIGACLSSLIDGDPFMSEVRVVVADGGSEDGTADLVHDLSGRYPNVRCIDNPARLQSAAINEVGFRHSEPGHVYLVRCDAHSVYPTGYARKVAESLASRDAAASIATAMDAAGSGCFQRAAGWLVDTRLGSGGSAHRGGQRSGWVDHGHHAGIRLDWFHRIGGYDESFSHNEDAEFDHRLSLAGGRVWFDADIRLQYQIRDSLAGLWLQYWRYGRGRARTILKHRVRPRVRQVLPVAAAAGVGLSLAIGAIWPPALLLAGLYFALAVGVSLAGVAALRSPCGLWAGPAMLAIHMAWGLGFLWQAMFRGQRP